jgi:hypothetical protein
MGVKYGRAYTEILRDLSQAIQRVRHFYDFIQMKEQEWRMLDEKERSECVKTLADDVFYALGHHRSFRIGAGRVQYIRHKHIIIVQDGDNVVTIVNLV